MALLSRVAEQLYWVARYVERAEDTARIVGAYTEVVVDLPVGLGVQWDALLAIAGGREQFDAEHAKADESSIIDFVVADRSNPSSITSSVRLARENLRSCREVMPRLAWQVVNDLHQHVGEHRAEAVSRRSRTRFCDQVVASSLRFTGVVDSVLSRDAAFDFLQLGQALERADMTTRVLGVRAAALMSGERAPAAVDASEAFEASEAYDGVQWMGILRSLSALQMFQRSTRASVSGPSVVDFLLMDRYFPRSVVACLHRIGEALDRLPRGDEVRPAVARVYDVVSMVDAQADDGELLDQATDRIQLALAELHGRIIETYVATAPAGTG